MNVQDRIPASVRNIFTHTPLTPGETATCCAVCHSPAEPQLEPQLRFLLEAFINGLEAVNEEIGQSHPQLWEPLDRAHQLLDHMQAFLNLN